jgi:hypothetical protein
MGAGDRQRVKGESTGVPATGGGRKARGIVACLLLVAVALAACDPVVSIGGANFPDWLICVMAGASLAALCRPVLIFAGCERYLRPLVIFYGSLIILFALLSWLIFFNRV